jgi:hypothetical protein
MPISESRPSGAERLRRIGVGDVSELLPDAGWRRGRANRRMVQPPSRSPAQNLAVEGEDEAGVKAFRRRPDVPKKEVVVRACLDEPALTGLVHRRGLLPEVEEEPAGGPLGDVAVHAFVNDEAGLAKALRYLGLTDIKFFVCVSEPVFGSLPVALGKVATEFEISESMKLFSKDRCDLGDKGAVIPEDRFECTSHAKLPVSVQLVSDGLGIIVSLIDEAQVAEKTLSDALELASLGRVHP